MYQKKTINKSFLWNALPAVIIFTVLYLYRGVPFFIDDPYVSFRYAVNWASGNGPVYNIGEYVEGYSCFLWVAILTIGTFFTSDPVKLAASLNLFIGIANLFVMSYVCNLIEFSKPRLMAIVLPLFCALSYGFYFYGATGFEPLIVSLILMLSIISIHKSKISGNYFITLPHLFLLTIVRAEGPLYAIVLLAILTYFVYREQRTLPKKLSATIAILISLIILTFVLRFSIYHELVPATVLAKGYTTYLIKKILFEGAFQEAKMFIRVIFSGFKYEAPLLFLGAWIPFVMLLRNENKKNFLLWLFASSIAANVFVSIWAGGDEIFPHKRHLVPVFPILFIFVAWAVDLFLCRYWSKLQSKKAALSVVMLIMLFLWIDFFIRPTLFTKKYVEEGQFVYLRQIGTLVHNLPVSTTLLTDKRGILPYYSGSNVYVRDTFGLTDIHNAKYGELFHFSGGSVNGRTDLTYSFASPFDIAINTSRDVNKRFIAFCQENPSTCEKYRFFKKEDWVRLRIYVIANIKHPVSTALKEKFGAVPVPIDENLNNDIFKNSADSDNNTDGNIGSLLQKFVNLILRYPEV